jgi:MYXO-CTERM domain-containing protein
MAAHDSSAHTKEDAVSKAFVPMIALTLIAAAGVAQADFSYNTNFSNETPDLQFVGAASTSLGSARLTQSSLVEPQASAMWRTSSESVGLGFDTTFTYRLSNPLGNPDRSSQIGGDGFAFVIQGQGNGALGGAGGYIGYEGITNSLAIEFDTFQNNSFGDINSNHVAIMSRGVNANSANHFLAERAAILVPGDMNDGLTGTARVRYEAGVLNVFLNGSETPSMSAAIDLSSELGLINNQAFIGFTGGTWSSAATQEIDTWTYTSVPTPAGAAVLGLGGLVLTRRRRA